jgi:uncharacterized protein YybS (DUF2232 family)
VGLGLGLFAIEAGELHYSFRGLSGLVSLVPLAVAFAQAGFPGAAVAGAVAAAATAVTFSPSAGVVLLVRHVVPGVLLGVALTRRWHLSAGLLAVSGASLVGFLVLLWTYAPAGTTLGSLYVRQLEAQLAELDRLSTRLALGGDPAWVAESTRLVGAAMQQAGPAVILDGLLVMALVNYLLARLCLRGRGFRAFAEEAVPDHLVWAVIVGGAMLVSQSEPVERVGLNLLVVLAPLYAIQGLAVLRHLFQKARVPRPLQGVSFGLFVVQPLLLVLAACVGLSDLWIDFRKIRQAPTPA